MISVPYVPDLSRNLLSTSKPMEQWGKPLIDYKTKAVLGFKEEVSPLFKYFSLRDPMRIPGQGAALAVAAKARDMIKVNRVLAYPCEEITPNTTKTIRETTDQWGSSEARLEVKTKQQAVQWIDGPNKIGRGGIGVENLGSKPGKDEEFVIRGAPQLDIQELEQQLASNDPEEETREVPLNPKEETRKVPSDSEETREIYHRILTKRHGGCRRISRRHRGRRWIRGATGGAARSRAGGTGGAARSRSTGGAVGSRRGDKI